MFYGIIINFKNQQIFPSDSKCVNIVKIIMSDAKFADLTIDTDMNNHVTADFLFFVDMCLFSHIMCEKH